MQRYRLEVEGIPEYINILKDAQKQVGQVGHTISDETFPLFAITAMLTTEQYPRTNDDWEDKSEEQKTCAGWKTSYKRVHAKVYIKAQATEGSYKFGSANAAK